MTKVSTYLLLFIFALSGCDDPEKQGLEVFKQQGLNVLQPARDYIALGGVFNVPKHGPAIYKDPNKTDIGKLPPVDGAATSFNSTDMQQSMSGSAGFQVAVGTLGGLVTVPAGLKFSDSRQVALGQIDSSGTRLTSEMVDTLIQMANTKATLTKVLKAGSRAFVVQELYTAKSLSLKSSDGLSLAAAVMGTPTPVSCSTSSGGNGITKPSTTTNSGSTPSSGTKPANGAKGAVTSKGGKAQTSTGSGTSNQGVSVGVCWANDFTLSFKSDTAVTFAVRLNQVVWTDNKKTDIQVSDKGFNLPNSSLGPEDVKNTALINPDDPRIGVLIHQLAEDK